MILVINWQGHKAAIELAVTDIQPPEQAAWVQKLLQEHTGKVHHIPTKGSFRIVES